MLRAFFEARTLAKIQVNILFILFFYIFFCLFSDSEFWTSMTTICRCWEATTGVSYLKLLTQGNIWSIFIYLFVNSWICNYVYEDVYTFIQLTLMIFILIVCICLYKIQFVLGLIIINHFTVICQVSWEETAHVRSMGDAFQVIRDPGMIQKLQNCFR